MSELILLLWKCQKKVRSQERETYSYAVYKNIKIHVFNCFILFKTLHLKFKDIAQKHITEGDETEKNRIILKGRSYVHERNHYKIIVTNIPPHVLHDLILELIKSHGIAPFSPMKFL